MEITGKEICELVARYLYDAVGKRVDPQSIWNLSPSGELYPVYALYEAARVYYRMVKIHDEPPEEAVAGDIIYMYEKMMDGSQGRLCSKVFISGNWMILGYLP